MFTRKASAPARRSFASISGDRLAGPIVASTLTLRLRGSSLCIPAAYCRAGPQDKDGVAMDTNSDPLDTLDDAQAAAAFRRLVRHLRHRTDAQNIELMGLAGVCRNCLAAWIRDAGYPGDKDAARELIHGMPADEWKTQHQSPATQDQLDRMAASIARNAPE